MCRHVSTVKLLSYPTYVNKISTKTRAHDYDIQACMGAWLELQINGNGQSSQCSDDAFLGKGLLKIKSKNTRVGHPTQKRPLSSAVEDD